MKRIISVILLICMLASGVPVLAKDIPQQSIKNAQLLSQAVETLAGLKIIDEPQENLEAAVTKAEFLNLVIKLINVDIPEEVTMKKTFSDLTTTHQYYKQIATSVNLGFADGKSDGRFEPDVNISNEEACKILVTVLGYNVLADNTGGFPTGYLSVANDINLYKNISINNSAELQKQTVIMLMYNALDIEKLAQNTFEAGNVQFKKGETLLYHYHKIKKEKGIMQANYLTKLGGVSELKEKQVMINSAVFENQGKNIDHLIGYKVTYYYSDESGINILYFAVPESDNKVYKLKSTDILSYSNSRYTYFTSETGNDTDLLKVSKNADIIYNSEWVSDTRVLDYVPEEGNVVGIDNNNDDFADVLFINESRNLVVEYYNNKEEIIYGKYANDKLEVNRQSFDYQFILVNTKNETVDPLKLKEYDVITYFKSMDGDSVKAILNDGTVEGNISEIAQYHNVDMATVDHVNYLLSKDFDEYNKNAVRKLSVGDNVKAYLDYYGKIAAVVYDGNTNQEYIGYLYNGSLSKGVGHTLKLKIFTGKGKFETYNCTKKVTLNNQGGSIDQVYGGLQIQDGEDKKVKKQIIMYSLNSNSEITNIDLVGGDNGYQDHLQQLVAADVKLKYMSASRFFGQKIAVDDKTVIFQVPVDRTRDEDYAVKSITDFENDKPYRVSAYNDDAKSFVSSAILYEEEEGDNLVSDTTPLTLVEDITWVMDKYGEKAKKLIGNRDGVTVSAIAESEGLLDGIASGDVIRFTANLRGEIHHVAKIYDYSEKSFTAGSIASPNATTTDLLAKYRIAQVNVYQKEGAFMKGITGTPAATPPADYEIHLAKNFKIVYYNHKKSKIEMGTDNDLRDYIHSGSNYSKVLISTSYGAPKMLVILN